jgi:hypothetical protein
VAAAAQDPTAAGEARRAFDRAVQGLRFAAAAAGGGCGSGGRGGGGGGGGGSGGGGSSKRMQQKKQKKYDGDGWGDDWGSGDDDDDEDDEDDEDDDDEFHDADREDDDDEANVSGGGGGGGGGLPNIISVRYFPLPYVPLARGAFVMPSGGAAAAAIVSSTGEFGDVDVGVSSGSQDIGQESSFSLPGLLPPKEDGDEEDGVDAPVPLGVSVLANSLAAMGAHLGRAGHSSRYFAVKHRWLMTPSILHVTNSQPVVVTTL